LLDWSLDKVLHDKKTTAVEIKTQADEIVAMAGRMQASLPSYMAILVKRMQSIGAPPFVAPSAAAAASDAEVVAPATHIDPDDAAATAATSAAAAAADVVA
jgi:hypothetical protein